MLFVEWKRHLFVTLWIHACMSSAERIWKYTVAVGSIRSLIEYCLETEISCTSNCFIMCVYPWTTNPALHISFYGASSFISKTILLLRILAFSGNSLFEFNVHVFCFTRLSLSFSFASSNIFSFRLFVEIFYVIYTAIKCSQKLPLQWNFVIAVIKKEKVWIFLSIKSC